MSEWKSTDALREAPHPLQARLASWVGKPLFWAVFVGALFAAPLIRGLRGGPLPAPPAVLGSFPHFQEQDDRGMAFGSGDLRGHAFFVNLICVRCGGKGALAVETMRILQHRSRNLGDALRLVSFATDGDPPALAAVRRERPSSERWALLAGAPPGVRVLFPNDQGLLLVDGRSRIRGRYPSSDSAASTAALRDAALVLNEP
jgi:hypothetical protein